MRVFTAILSLWALLARLPWALACHMLRWLPFSFHRENPQLPWEEEGLREYSGHQLCFSRN